MQHRTSSPPPLKRVRRGPSPGSEISNGHRDPQPLTQAQLQGPGRPSSSPSIMSMDAPPYGHQHPHQGYPPKNLGPQYHSQGQSQHPGPSTQSQSQSQGYSSSSSSSHIQSYGQSSSSSSHPHQQPQMHSQGHSHSHHYPQSKSHNPPTTPLPPLSLSILGLEPFDEFIKEIADFVHHTIMTSRHQAQIQEQLQGQPAKVEVEAKIGVLRERASPMRIDLPVLVETILTPGDRDGRNVDIRFEANMSVQQHKHLNTLLNELKTQSLSQSHSQSSQPSLCTSPLDYEHLHLVDSFFNSARDSPSISNANGERDNRDKDRERDKGKIRVTRDEKTGEVLECVRKIRLADLNVYCPKREVDWRISVNLEIPMQHPLGTPTHTRRKDRMSYTHEEFKIDLTQVTTSPSASIAVAPQISHELELEIARPDFLLSTALKRNDPHASEVERSAFDELMRAFVNNVRILVRNASL